MSVLLITSRETRRWVIPKGNPIKGRLPHEAAAQEAFEEAGLTGAACPTELGRFRYLKQRPSGPPRELEVAVFPLAVHAQAEDWPERHERNTRWFTLADAAGAVMEPQLKAIINRFRAPSAGQPAALARTGRGRPMLAWFQALLPKQGRFFELFEAHSQLLCAGAKALALLLNGDGRAGDHIAEIVRREQDADDLTRDVLQDVRRVFVTPFDRSAIIDMIGAMDDSIDEMNKTAKSIELYELTEFEPRMRDMGGIIVEAARVTSEAIPLLRNVGRNADRLNELTARLIEIEGHADEIHAAGLKELYRQHGATQPMAFIVGRELFSHLERIVDRFEDVANEIQGLVIDHA